MQLNLGLAVGTESGERGLTEERKCSRRVARFKLVSAGCAPASAARVCADEACPGFDGVVQSMQPSHCSASAVCEPQEGMRAAAAIC